LVLTGSAMPWAGMPPRPSGLLKDFDYFRQVYGLRPDPAVERQRQLPPAREDRVRRAVRDLLDVPSWLFSFRKSDPQVRSEIIRTTTRLGKYDLDVLREAVVRVLALQGNDLHALCNLQRIYILNRCLLGAPAWVPERENRFGEFHGAPHRNGNWNLLWPVAIDRRGRLSLVGVCGPGTAKDPDVLGEFDYFRKKYGLRRSDTRSPGRGGKSRSTPIRRGGEATPTESAP